MAAIQWTDVVAFAPQLSTVGVAEQNDILAHVNTAHKIDVFGGEDAQRLRMARIFLAAHIATLNSYGGTVLAGPVISETAGDISRSYALANAYITDGEKNAWSATSYGQMYAMLIRTSAARMPKVFD